LVLPLTGGRGSGKIAIVKEIGEQQFHTPIALSIPTRRGARGRPSPTAR
jgi:hypothetical protein